MLGFDGLHQGNESTHGPDSSTFEGLVLSWCERLGTPLAQDHFYSDYLTSLVGDCIHVRGNIPHTSGKYGPQSSYTARAPVQADSATVFTQVCLHACLCGKPWRGMLSCSPPTGDLIQDSSHTGVLREEASHMSPHTGFRGGRFATRLRPSPGGLPKVAASTPGGIVPKSVVTALALCIRLAKCPAHHSL